ncbi:MAG: NTP transferase domain-containing protein [Deltaproteobacteria bacterium]|nr:NTP transferase domain-containing protein [Deltaproteobacteria bacterium]
MTAEVPGAPFRSSVALLVLAGGEGRRLGGVTKPLLRSASGRRLIDSLIEALEPVADEVWILSTERTRAELSAAGFQERLLVDPGTGPAGALEVAAASVSSEWLALVAGDLHAPSRALLDRLLRSASQGRPALVAHEGRLQPQVSVWPTSRIRALHDLSGRSLRSVAEALGAITIDASVLPPDELRGLEGVNVPSDLEKLRVAPNGE